MPGCFLFNIITSSNGIISALLALCAGNPLTKASDAELWFFFDLCLNKRLGKQSWDCWFDTPHCDVIMINSISLGASWLNSVIRVPLPIYHHGSCEIGTQLGFPLFLYAPCYCLGHSCTKWMNWFNIWFVLLTMQTFLGVCGYSILQHMDAWWVAQGSVIPKTAYATISGASGISSNWTKTIDQNTAWKVSRLWQHRRLSQSRQMIYLCLSKLRGTVWQCHRKYGVLVHEIV